MKRTILASASPRRAELIKLVLPKCECIAANIDETVPEGMPLSERAEYLGGQKAEAIAKRFPNAVVIGCDTVVIIDGVLLGKPKDKDDAARMLRMLLGRTHTVITGVSIISDGVKNSFSESTVVEFRRLSEGEIADYVESGDPMDKAGAYRDTGRGRSARQAHKRGLLQRYGTARRKAERGAS